MLKLATWRYGQSVAAYSVRYSTSVTYKILEHLLVKVFPITGCLAYKPARGTGHLADWILNSLVNLLFERPMYVVGTQT